ncbi:helix-turn-helix domain-containing protein [Nocardia cyriacigeorgica]|uniref:helix-turn-helix transcriptional regulator n=1 Tax=Nocardia cyriacigeorgica TaxID=135487 RepID=UPI001895E97A|nr:helix-turn-helix transcriptional regulator [Nocardia cyriacigeorgica]MBF6320775.1 helix-turn-helix domain-containing protein [Nocardia cyriacigeorgica]MBF6346667.1 helix-turn-helix domain-containing protein [Nocardia cyriacigeorgica]MBF6514582.1 helix-turn-helix domain-containing protein [Nocardia cyriacigeorgica]MBF6535187.1 helix-turn-helix domain-containing protein [Nocardia cyriacigeorgica]
MNALAEFLRARRGSIGPGEVGLPIGPRNRRTPGLRREELAALAGVSMDYYTRIEQGRETAPSDAVLGALARALRLSDDEHAHLLALADRTAGRLPRRRPVDAQPVPPGLRLLLDSVRPSPAYVLNEVNDVVAANVEGLALMPGLGDWQLTQRNTIRYTFRHAAARTLFADWDRVARNCVAQLRSAEPASPESVATLVAQLSAASTEFDRLWRQHQVGVKRGGETAFRHPLIGEVTLANEVLHHLGSGQRVLLYQAPPESAEHDALVLLSMSAHSAAPRW